MLTNIERETIVTFNEAEDLAEVFTFNRPMQRRLATLAQLRPADVTQTGRDDTDGQVSVTYTVPKGWVKINAPRVLSMEQLEAARLKAQKAREHRAQNRVSG